MLKKVVASIILIFIMCVCLSNNVCAMDNVISAGDSFLQAGESSEAVIDEDSLKETSNYIYNVLVAIAIVIAIVMGTIIGIQFITGSVEQQAKVKETLIPYIIGVFVVFSAFTIWKIAVTIGNNVSSSRGSHNGGSVTDKSDIGEDAHTRD